MSACEWCWAEANRRVLLLGGAVSDRYAEVLREQQELGKDRAVCPIVRAQPARLSGGTPPANPLREFYERLKSEQVDLPADAERILRDHYWDLLDEARPGGETLQ